MGYIGKIELKNEAQALRRQGKSYNEIISKLKLSKSTVSGWCRNVPLTNKQILHLYENKKTGALKGSYIAAKNKQDIRRKVTFEQHQKGVNEIGPVTDRDMFISGIALYAAEGTKIDKGCCFSNSDPKLISFMVRWFKKFGMIAISDFRAALWLHENLDEIKAKKYWSRLTGISLDHFYKTYIAQNKKNSRKIRKNIHQYGVISIYINNVMLLRKMMGWIDGVLLNT